MKEDIPTDPPKPKETWLDQLPINVNKKFWNTEKIISVSAFVISIATLLALMYQIRIAGEQNELVRQQQELMRKQQYASVLPYLEIWIGTNNKDQLFDLRLLNNGIGPAFIEEIRIVHNGQVYPGDPFTFYRTKIIQEDTIRMGFYNITKGRVIPAEKEIPMMSSNYFSSEEDLDKFTKWFQRPTKEPALAQVEIVYSSVYGERWITKGIGAIPELLPSEAAE